MQGKEAAQLGPSESDTAYPLPVFMQRAGLSRWAFRQARRNGLPVKVVGRRRYILGTDWLAFLANQAR